VDELLRAYGVYRKTARELFAGGASDTAQLRGEALGILTAIDRMHARRQNDLQTRLEEANSRERTAVLWTFVFSLTGLVLAIAFAVAFTYHTFSAIRKLQRATHRIAEGDFDHDLQIPPGDEIGDLAVDFTRMAARLKDLEQMSLDASPLTRLPGNIAIERIIERRLREGDRFALCYTDLDNFKSFTDHYGYVKGSELIRLTGEMIYEAAREHGGSDAFVGHIGGDDFVMILDAEKVGPVCEAVLRKFDGEVVKHYSTEDLYRGGIEGPDRYGVQRFFPIMTLSIAVVINEAGEYSTSAELAMTASEIKDYVKEKPGSNYLVSHRRKRPR